MPYQLAPNIHCAFIGERAVILDVARDRYRLLAPPGAAVLRSAGTDRPLVEGLSRLEALGIVHPGPSGIACPIAPSPAKSVLEADHPPAASLDFAAVALTLFRTMLVLRTRGLDRTLRRIRPRMTHEDGGLERAIDVAQSYRRHRSRIPLHQICLPDSLALQEMLRARDLGALLVIGVRLDPFAAHCWLQAGDIVLNDSCDNVSSFTPILVS